MSSLLLLFVIVLIVFLQTCAFKLLDGVRVNRLTKRGDESVDLASVLEPNTLCVLGTYAADFNCVEYGQRLRYYLPALKEKGVKKFAMIVNGRPTAATLLAKLVDLPEEVQLYTDPTGTAGRAFGVARGFRPEDTEMSPYVKLFAMLFGLGAWATLPSVIGGYIGNPFTAQPWIEDAMAVGQRAGRWPNNALELDSDGKVVTNKFSELPLVSEWGRRPLELATLRLQNMIGVSLKNWDELKPTDSELESGVLTQLGGLIITGDRKDSPPRYEWRDAGICHVANFEDIIKKL
jgi:AhpC/TSA antioxidant enzyme